MKRIMIVIVLLSICWVSCNNEPAIDQAATKILADTSKYTTIQWLDSIVNFGSIKMGEQTKVAYRFKNSGNQPLFLANVKAGCGCTAPDYTKGAIAPGGEGVVTGAFDSNKAHKGEVRKYIYVTTNTKNKTDHTLIFTGLITEPDSK
jgi:hypothetical protein